MRPPFLQVGVAVVGAGRWGMKVVGALARSPTARLVAVCDTDPAALAASRAMLPDVPVVPSIGPLLEDARIEAVCVATPPATHEALAAAALAAGKHVFVEKPMALSARGARRLLRLTSKSGRRLMVGHVLLYHPAVRALGRALGAGELGAIRALASVRHTMDSGRVDDAWWALAPHDVSLMRHLMGADPSMVSVASFGRAPANLGASAALAFAGGVPGLVQVQAGAETKIRRLFLATSRYVVLFDDVEPTRKLRVFAPTTAALRAVRELAVPDSSELQIPGLTDGPTTAAPLDLEVEHFLGAILADHPIRSDAAEGARVVAILEAGARSRARGGAVVRVPREVTAALGLF